MTAMNNIILNECTCIKVIGLRLYIRVFFGGPVQAIAISTTLARPAVPETWTSHGQLCPEPGGSP